MPVPAIETRDLTKLYGPAVGVEGLHLDVQPGEIFGFLGPNGAGKTTTIRLLLDLIRPTRGEALLFGRPARDPASRGRVGYLPDDLALDERITGRQTLRFFDALRGAGSAPADPRRTADLCGRLGLTAADLDRPVGDDSRGTKQKIGLAAALQGDPDLLILDEPTTGLDPLVREAVFEILREAGGAGRTVFLSSHVLSEVDRTCTRVGILRAGRLVAVQRVEEMRRSAVRRMVVRFGGDVPVSDLSLPGIEIVEREGGRAVLRVSGDLGPLLGALARHPVLHLVFPEPDLEEAFVRWFRGAGGDAP